MEYKASATAIVEFCKSPKHYQHYAKRKKKTTDAMKFGTAFHMAMLEPERFLQRVKTIDQVAKEVIILKNKDEFLSWLDSKEITYDKKIKKDAVVELALANRTEGDFYLESEAKEKFIVLGDEKISDLESMQANAQKHHFYKMNKDHGQKELKLKGIIEGVEITGQLDQTFKKKATNFIIDYKTCKSVAERDFFYKIIREKAFVQMAIYKELLKQNYEGVDRVKNIWFGVETVEPFICQPFVMAEASQYDSDLYLKQKLHEFKIVLETQDFFGYTNENYGVIEIPNYAYENVFDLKEPEVENDDTDGPIQASE